MRTSIRCAWTLSFTARIRRWKEMCLKASKASTPNSALADQQGRRGSEPVQRPQQDVEHDRQGVVHRVHAPAGRDAWGLIS
jgi:hypothetical protein